MRKVTTGTSTRSTVYRTPDGYEFVFKQIRDLGNFVEIESHSDDTEALNAELPKMKTFLNSIGITDEMIVEKGYVPLIMEKMEQEKK